MQSYLAEVNKHYETRHPHLKRFVEDLYHVIDYDSILRAWSEGQRKSGAQKYNLYTLHVHTINRILRTKMCFPDGRELLVSEAPPEEIKDIIDYFGYLIGMARGQGNYSLIEFCEKFSKYIDVPDDLPKVQYKPKEASEIDKYMRLLEKRKK
jgi:hypothetical protein